MGPGGVGPYGKTSPTGLLGLLGTVYWPITVSSAGQSTWAAPGCRNAGRGGGPVQVHRLGGSSVLGRGVQAAPVAARQQRGRPGAALAICGDAHRPPGRPPAGHSVARFYGAEALWRGRCVGRYGRPPFLWTVHELCLLSRVPRTVLGTLVACIQSGDGHRVRDPGTRRRGPSHP